MEHFKELFLYRNLMDLDCKQGFIQFFFSPLGDSVWVRSIELAQLPSSTYVKPNT